MDEIDFSKEKVKTLKKILLEKFDDPCKVRHKHAGAVDDFTAARAAWRRRTSSSASKSCPARANCSRVCVAVRGASATQPSHGNVTFGL